MKIKELINQLKLYEKHFGNIEVCVNHEEYVYGVIDSSFIKAHDLLKEDIVLLKHA